MGLLDGWSETLQGTHALAVDPVRRQLAGAGGGAFGHRFPTAQDAPLRERFGG